MEESVISTVNTFQPVLKLPGGMGIPSTAVSVPATVRVPGITRGTVCVPGTADTHVSLMSSSMFLHEKYTKMHSFTQNTSQIFWGMVQPPNYPDPTPISVNLSVLLFSFSRRNPGNFYPRAEKLICLK